jgi:ribosomal protein S18 acetylase RimI-like enzyme
VLEEMIVSEMGRGLGIGRILLQAAIDSAQRRGCAEMGLCVVNGLGSRPFYEKMGFEFEGTAGGKWCSKILQSDYTRMDAAVNNEKVLARMRAVQKAKEAASKARL